MRFHLLGGKIGLGPNKAGASNLHFFQFALSLHPSTLFIKFT